MGLGRGGGLQGQSGFPTSPLSAANRRLELDKARDTEAAGLGKDVPPPPAGGGVGRAVGDTWGASWMPCP